MFQATTAPATEPQHSTSQHTVMQCGASISFVYVCINALLYSQQSETVLTRSYSNELRQCYCSEYSRSNRVLNIFRMLVSCVVSNTKLSIYHLCIWVSIHLSIYWCVFVSVYLWITSYHNVPTHHGWFGCSKHTSIKYIHVQNMCVCLPSV